MTTARVISGSLVTSFLLTSLVFAQTGSTPASQPSPTTVTPPAQKGAVNGECVATAVGVREDALIAAHNAHNTSVTSALSTRKTELMAAWKLTDNKARRTAREAAWTKFREARKAATKLNLENSRKAYAAFNAATKACGVQYKEQAEGGQGTSL